MPLVLAQGIVWAVLLYLAVGLLFSVPFVLRGVNRIDPVASESAGGFRIMIVPGVIALWPILARRWIGGSPPPAERNAHRGAARERAS